MNETFVKLTSLLGHSCQAGRGEDSTPRQQDKAKQSLKEMFDEEHAKSWEHSISFPSFSLDHAQGLKTEGSQTKEDVQMQASALLAQPIHVDISGGCKEFESIPNVMMENVYSSFDKLVDARILAYSKILGNHGLTLAESHWKGSVGDDLCSGAQVIEYKLKTLLEIGTNIYADSVASTFTIDGDYQIEEGDGWTEITYPISMEVEINDIRLPCSESHNIKVSFEAPGTIQGIFFAQNSEQRLQAVHVDVDCNSLLLSMIEEASKVVSLVVDLTNEAWNREDQASDATRITTPTKVPGTNQLVSPESEPLPFLPKDSLPFIPLSLDCLSPHFVGRKRPFEECYHESESDAIIDVENVSTIVDYAIGEIDEYVIAKPAYKKQRLLESI